MSATDKPKARPRAKSGPSEKRKSSKALAFALPSAAAFKEIGRGLRLSAEQANNLGLAVRHAHADLEDHQRMLASRRPRPELVRRIERLSKAFSDLKDECDRQARHLEHILPLDMRADLGRIMTLSAMLDAIGEAAAPRQLEEAIRLHGKDGERTSVQDFEQATAAIREMLGLKHAPALLPYLIGRLSQPLADWVAAESLNKGGNPGEVARNYLISRLAQAAPEIIGRKAAVSKTGPFVRLCETVVQECGMEMAGVSEAVARIAADMRKKAKAR